MLKKYRLTNLRGINMAGDFLALGVCLKYPLNSIDKKKGVTLLGYCDANSLPYEPRELGIAIMVWNENDKAEYWLHWNGLIEDFRI